MSTSRRTFLKLSAIAGGSVGLGLVHGASAFSEPSGSSVGSTGHAAKPLRILILGGTGFTGPHQVRYALSRGHQVHALVRPGSEAKLPPGAQPIVGNALDEATFGSR